MKVLELHLSQQTASRLQEAAERLSVSPEELSILSIEEKLAQLEDEFRRSAEYALQKNAELYRRLADAHVNE
jgi:antitoxin FitA